MKKIIGICLIVLLSSASLMAQDNRRGDRPQRVDPKERTEQLIKDLKLNEEQAVEFRKIQEELTEKMQKMRENMSENRDERRAEMEKRREEMQKMRDETNEKVKKILTEDQYKEYLKKQQPPRDGQGNRQGRRDRNQ